MKKLIIALLFIGGCSGMQISSDFFKSSPSTKKYSQIKEVDFDIKKNELIWSRVNSYLYGFLNYEILSPYNPYILNVKNENPYKEITIVREIDESKIKLRIIYNCILYKEKSKDKSMPHEVIEMKILFDDLLEYLETGKHKDLTPKAVEGEIKKSKDEKKMSDKDTFFFY